MTDILTIDFVAMHCPSEQVSGKDLGAGHNRLLPYFYKALPSSHLI